jgi:hypothetical protein
MGTVEFQTRQTFDRRIGRRVDTETFDVSWVIARSGRFGSKKPPIEAAGQIQNVSVTGAAITGPDHLPLEPGSTALVRLKGRDSVVVVRHREPLEQAGTMRYGVELTRPHPSLKKLIHDSLSEAAIAALVAEPAVVEIAEPVLDLTGPEPVIDLTDPKPVAAVAAGAPATPAEPTIEPVPEASVDTTTGVEAAPPSPPPVDPQLHGRSVLDQVFDLMDD